ncbi:MAG: hypothetical protein ACKVTZ_19555 [Bacteroidia bacterium]
MMQKPNFLAFFFQTFYLYKKHEYCAPYPSSLSLELKPTDDGQESIGIQRARKVKRYLIQVGGISADRIIIAPKATVHKEFKKYKRGNFVRAVSFHNAD